MFFCSVEALMYIVLPELHLQCVKVTWLLSHAGWTSKFKHHFQFQPPWQHCCWRQATGYKMLLMMTMTWMALEEQGQRKGNRCTRCVHFVPLLWFLTPHPISTAASCQQHHSPPFPTALSFHNQHTPAKSRKHAYMGVFSVFGSHSPAPLTRTPKTWPHVRFLVSGRSPTCWT